MLNELIKSKKVSGFYVVSPSKYNLHALFLRCKLLKYIMFADSGPCNQSGLPVCIYGHACAYLHLHAWHIHLCMCAYMCFSCSHAQPSCRPLGFWIAPLSCLLSLMPALLLCFLWSEASQSCMLKPFWSVFRTSAQPPFCGFGSYHLANGFWPFVSGPVTALELWPQHLSDRSTWRLHLFSTGSCLSAGTGVSLQGKPHSPSVSSCLCFPPLLGQQSSQFCLHCS